MIHKTYKRKMSKNVRSEANRVAMAIKGNKSAFYVADVECGDNAKDTFDVVPAVKKILAKTQCNFLLISADLTHLNVVVSTTPDCQVNPTEWLLASLKNIGNAEIQVETFNDNEAGVSLAIEYPFKLKDVVRSSAFEYLRHKRLIEEESSEEELFDF
jgi:ribosomal protein L4